jgi:hypothetical protein
MRISSLLWTYKQHRHELVGADPGLHHRVALSDLSAGLFIIQVEQSRVPRSSGSCTGSKASATPRCNTSCQ